MNRQLNNCGNQGDIIKHAALIKLAKLLLRYGKSRFAYIESHTFMLEVACPSPAQWLQETKAELAKHPAYDDYFNAEKQVLDGQPYRCSAGLVIHELKKANTTDPISILAEKDEATREVLKGQLLKERVRNCTVLEDALDLGSITLPDDVKTILILVDPFVLDAETWNGIAAGLNKTIKPGMDVVLEVFTYDKQLAKVDWPAPPSGMIGPVSVMHRQPYHLAVYATDTLKDDVGQVCQDLGWSMYE